jgi:hypothetical protein
MVLAVPTVGIAPSPGDCDAQRHVGWPLRVVSAWTFSTMRLMLFREAGTPDTLFRFSLNTSAQDQAWGQDFRRVV